jgi:hypothetical protein
MITVQVFMRSTRHSCQIVIKLESSRQAFEKSWNIKFHEKSVQWEPSCSMWTDMSKLTVAFLTCSYALNNEVPARSAISGLLYYVRPLKQHIRFPQRNGTAGNFLSEKLLRKWPSVFYAVLCNKSVRKAPKVPRYFHLPGDWIWFRWMFRHSTTWRKSPHESYEQTLQCRHAHTHTHTGCTSRVQFTTYQASYLWMHHCNCGQLLGLKWYSQEVTSTEVTWLAHC